MSESQAPPGWYPVPGTQPQINGYWDGSRWRMLPVRHAGGKRRGSPNWMTAVGVLVAVSLALFLVVGLMITDPSSQPNAATHHVRVAGILDGEPVTLDLMSHFGLSIPHGTPTAWRVVSGELPVGVRIAPNGVLHSEGSAAAVSDYPLQLIFEVSDHVGHSWFLTLELVVLKPNTSRDYIDHTGMFRTTVHWDWPDVNDPVVEVFDLGSMGAADFAERRANDEFVRISLTEGPSIAHCYPGSEGPHVCEVRFLPTSQHVYMTAVTWIDDEGKTQWNFWLDRVE